MSIRFARSGNAIIVEKNAQFFKLSGLKGIKGISSLLSLSRAQLLVTLEAAKEPVKFQTLSNPINPAKTIVLGAGVTFNNSLRERRLETFRAGSLENVLDDGRPTPYDVVYDPANPPEVFFKALLPGHLAKPNELYIRPDGAPDGSMGSSVPEPERVLYVNPQGEIVAHSVGSDTTARQLESRSPLYLPAAKTYPGCTTLCPWLTVYDPSETVLITMEIFRKGQSMYRDSYSSDQSKRTAESLVAHARTLAETANGVFKGGFALFTGTGIIPPIEFSLAPSDVVIIESAQLGKIEAKTKIVRYTI